VIETSKSHRYHWLVCESGHRWRQSVVRLTSDWLSNQESITFRSLLASEVSVSTSRLPYGVLLWELDAASLVPAIQAIGSLSVDRDRWLQIVAVDRLSHRDRCAVSEMGVAAVVRHPEELPSLARMISGHFAGARRLLH
jgi:hypothetical protein